MAGYSDLSSEEHCVSNPAKIEVGQRNKNSYEYVAVSPT